MSGETPAADWLRDKMIPMGNSQPASFATTRWSLVVAAGQRAAPESDQALAALCQAYWPPVYVFVRRQVAEVNEAQDLTQSFFAHLLEKNLLTVAQPERGRFRSFLLTSVRNFLLNEWDKQKAAKRGGGKLSLSLDFRQHDSTYVLEPADTLTPERQFQRQWALGLLDQVMTRLRTEFVNAGKERLFDCLKGSLSGSDVPLAEIARQLGISENAAKVAAHRLRKRYREVLRAEVAQTLTDPADIDDEIRQLFAALGP
jgi:RNA polymerase sigma-70 factor (ECF subfamily)